MKQQDSFYKKCTLYNEHCFCLQ